MRLSIAGMVLVLTLAAFPGAGRAETLYEDADSEYLKVASFFVEPVGRILEWVVFRPIHAVHHWITPAQTLDGRPARECTGLRPRRDCVRY
jgi:hypothetical protein